MATNKAKAFITGIIPSTIIAIITTISLWPTNLNDDMPNSEKKHHSMTW